MSLRIKTFTGVIASPQNTHNFICEIPGIDSNIAMIIESTDYPAQGKFREVSLWYQGEQIRYPSIPENGGQWRFKIPEGDKGQVFAEFKKLCDKMYDQRTGAFIPQLWSDVHIYSRDLNNEVVYSVILHGCWFSERSTVSMDGTNPGNAWKWDFTLTYQWIEDVLGNAKGSINPQP